MEYVAGEDLKSRIQEKERLKEEEAISLAKQVCEGLAEAHRLGVIHRDLKPQNIMFDQESQAKIMDFGIARTIDSGDDFFLLFMHISLRGFIIRKPSLKKYHVWSEFG